LGEGERERGKEERKWGASESVCRVFDCTEMDVLDKCQKGKSGRRHVELI
jgi:hypothetical protein